MDELEHFQSVVMPVIDIDQMSGKIVKVYVSKFKQTQILGYVIERIVELVGQT